MKRAQIDKSFGLSGATRLAQCNLLPLSHSLGKLCPRTEYEPVTKKGETKYTHWMSAL